MEKKLISQTEMKEKIASYLDGVQVLAKEHFLEIFSGPYYAARAEVARVLNQFITEQDNNLSYTKDAWQQILIDYCTDERDKEIFFWEQIYGYIITETVEEILQ